MKKRPTLQTVIDVGNDIAIVKDTATRNFLIADLIVLVCSLATWLKIGGKIFYFITVLTVVLIPIAFFSHSFFQHFRKRFIDDWEREYVQPYLNYLPTQTFKLIDFTITGEDSAIITYKEEKGVTLTREAKYVDYKAILLPEDEPYIEAKVLESDLPLLYSRGLYHVTVYTPKEYTS